MAADANAADLDMLLEAADGGLMGILTKKPTTSNPYLKGKGSTADELADFNKAFMEQYGVTSTDPLGFEKALSGGDVSKIIKKVKVGENQYQNIPYISYIDRSGESPVNREFEASILSDYKILPKDEFKARYQGQFGDLGPAFTQMYDTFGDSQFSNLLEEYLPYATGSQDTMTGRSVFDRLSDFNSEPINIAPSDEIPAPLADSVEVSEDRNLFEKYGPAVIEELEEFSSNPLNYIKELVGG